MSKADIQEIELVKVERIIAHKINDFVEKYNKYPKYLKLPLLYETSNERYATFEFRL